eukprot:scaffold55673_cov38-Attheya_sp.AAC.1
MEKKEKPSELEKHVKRKKNRRPHGSEEGSSALTGSGSTAVTESTDPSGLRKQVSKRRTIGEGSGGEAPPSDRPKRDPDRRHVNRGKVRDADGVQRRDRGNTAETPEPRKPRGRDRGEARPGDPGANGGPPRRRTGERRAPGENPKSSSVPRRRPPSPGRATDPPDKKTRSRSEGRTQRKPGDGPPGGGVRRDADAKEQRRPKGEKPLDSK